MSEQHLLLDVPASVGEQLHAWLAGNASADVRVAIPALTVSTTFTFDPKAFDGRQWTPTTSKAVSSMQQLPNAPGVQALVQELIAAGGSPFHQNNRQETPIDSCSAPWSDELKGIAEFILAITNIQLELDALSEQRKATAQFLRKQNRNPREP